jgi:tRNA U38,U39,U40 pseudouridine synthase TruA
VEGGPVTKLTLAYDGGAFAGWARQPGLRTVQAELERAIEQILGEPVASPSRGAPTAACTPGRRSRATATRRSTRGG